MAETTRSRQGGYRAYSRHLKTLCNVQDAREGRCPAAAALFAEIVGQTSSCYVHDAYAPREAMIPADFDHDNVGLLAPSSRLNAFFGVQGKNLVCRYDFDIEGFARAFSALSQELSRQVGGPRVRLATIPTRS